MKGLQIVFLVAAGAIAGAVVMMVWQRPEPAHQPADAPPPVVAQVEKPNPVVAQPVEPPPAVSPQPAQPEQSVPAMAPPTHVAVRPPVGNIERQTKRPAASTNEPASPAAAESRSASSGASLLYPREAARTPPPVTPQETPTPPPTPPARMEPEKVTPVPAPPPEPHKATLNAGMLIPVRLVDGLSTERNKPGDRFTATLANELIADDFVIAERGARVEGRVVASDPGRTNGIAGLTVELTRLHTSDGQSIPIRTDSFERRPSVGAGAALPLRGMPATLPSTTRIPFRLGAAVALTERTR